MLLMSACPIAEEEINLLVNPSFEELDADGIPLGWYTDAYNKREGVSSFCVTEDGQSGQHAVLIENFDLNDARFAQTVAVRPNAMYRLSGWIKADGILDSGHGANLSIEGVYVFSEEPEQYVRLEELEIGNEVFGVVIDETEDIIKRRQIEAERDVDLLTGLYNRRGIETQIDLLFQKPEVMRHAAVVMIDADGLKGINDTYGHEMGDVYLKKVGSVINNFGIQSSLSARIGGDEFVLFLYDYDDENELLNTIRTIEYIQGHSTARLNENLTVPLRFSFGYCMLEEGLSYEEMLKTADERMYANKRMRKKEAVES